MTYTPLTDQQLADIRARRHLATGGTWYLQPAHGPNFVAAEHHGYEHGIGTLDFGVGDQADTDREFVLNAHGDITALLAEVDRLRAELAERTQLLVDESSERERAQAERDARLHNACLELDYADHPAPAWHLIASQS